MDPVTAIMLAKTAVDIGMKTHAAYKGEQAAAANHVVTYIQSNLGPDYAAMVLGSVEGGALLKAVSTDYNRKAAPFGDSKQRAGEATFYYLKPLLKAQNVPSYEKQRLYAAIFKRFGNEKRRKTYAGMSESLWPGYKGFYKTGKIDHVQVPAPTPPTAKTKGQQQLLLLGGAVAVLLILFALMKKGGSDER